jgi:hypothetical protein
MLAMPRARPSCRRLGMRQVPGIMGGYSGQAAARTGAGRQGQR